MSHCGQQSDPLTTKQTHIYKHFAIYRNMKNRPLKLLIIKVFNFF